LTIEGFETPFENSLSSENRWVKLAKVVPWDRFANIYMKKMRIDFGRPGFSPRMVLGALFRNIKQDSIVENLVADITIYFFALLNVFANRAGIDFIVFYEDLLTDPQAGIILKKLNLSLENMAAS
jgi:hypothetical protein